MVTEPELREMLFEAYLNKAVEQFVEEGINPNEVDVESLVISFMECIDDMISVEDDKGSIHFFHPSEEAFSAVFVRDEE